MAIESNPEQLFEEALSDVGGTLRTQDPALVAMVADGTRTVASAAWWGFDGIDALPALQAAFDSNADTVIVPDMDGSQWRISDSLRFRNRENRRIVVLLQSGVSIVAHGGKFHNVLDDGICLMVAEGQKEIRILGEPNALSRPRLQIPSSLFKRTPGDDRQLFINSDGGVNPQEKSQYGKPTRIALKLYDGISLVEVYGVDIDNFAGDGVWLRDVGSAIIQKVTCDSCRRSAVTVGWNVKYFKAEDCSFVNTIYNESGSGPGTGIDFEPFGAGTAGQWVVSRCRVENNGGPGVNVNLEHLGRNPDIADRADILLRACHIAGTQNQHGLFIGGLRSVDIVSIVRCTVSQLRYDPLPNSASVFVHPHSGSAHVDARIEDLAIQITRAAG